MGRVFNVTGDPVDEQGPVKADKYLPIHRAAPPLVDQSPSPQVLATGIKVNFLRFSSGEALARVVAEKNNPKVDVLFGGPVETFAAGIKENIFEPYKPPSFAALPDRFKSSDGQWVAIADDPLVFMTNTKFLQEHNLQPPAAWDDLLNPAYKSMLQMADARTSGTAVTRIFSILQVHNRDEDAAFACGRPTATRLSQRRQPTCSCARSASGARFPLMTGMRCSATSLSQR